MTIEELRRRLVLFVRLHVAEHAESYADEVLDRLGLKLQRGESSNELLCLQALAEVRSLVWDAKLRLARSESTELSALSITGDAARASARAALSVALGKHAVSRDEIAARTVAQPTRSELRDLLLHRLPEMNAQRIEEQLLLDGEVAAALRTEEGDLLDDYSAGRLNRDECNDVERFVITSSAARQRVKISRALHDVRNRRPGQSDPANTVAPWNRWSLRAAGAIVVCMLAVVFFLASLDDEVDPVPTPTRRASQAAPVKSDIDPAPAVASPDDPESEQASAPFNVLLLADQQSGFGAFPLSLTGDAADVRLQAQAPFGDVNARYRLAVQDEAGKPVFLANSLQAREAGGMVIVETLVPASSLGAGTRKVVLSPATSANAVATWTLDVQREP